MSRLITALLAVAVAGNAFAFQKKAAPQPAQDQPVSTAAPAPVTPAIPATAAPAPSQLSGPPVVKAKAKPTATLANSQAQAREAKRKPDAELQKAKEIPRPPPVSPESRQFIDALNAKLDEALK